MPRTGPSSIGPSNEKHAEAYRHAATPALSGLQRMCGRPRPDRAVRQDHKSTRRCLLQKEREREGTEAQPSQWRTQNAMASTSAAISLSSPSAFIDGKAPRQQYGGAFSHCISFPTPAGPTSRLQNLDTRGTATHRAIFTVPGRRVEGNFITMATGETQIVATGEAPSQEGSDVPEIFKTAQEAWDKLEDKYAVTVLTLAVVIALWGAGGLLSAIDRLPLIPGIFELIGIGYSGAKINALTNAFV
ncbi:hypothetical protein ACLOJK_032107 [Asimina triloba]